MKQSILVAFLALVLAGCLPGGGLRVECAQVGGCNPPPIVFVNGFILLPRW